MRRAAPSLLSDITTATLPQWGATSVVAQTEPLSAGTLSKMITAVREAPRDPVNLSRRGFLGRIGLATAGIVAADQFELLDRLGWVRTMFAGWTAPTAGQLILTNADFDGLLNSVYFAYRLELAKVLAPQSPFRASFGPKRLLPHPKGRTYLVRVSG